MSNEQIEPCYMPDCGMPCWTEHYIHDFLVSCSCCTYQSGKKESEAEAITAHNTIARQVKAAEVLREALEAAQEHLDYCGYGDSWERECAEESKLEAKIDAALALAPDTQEKEKT